MNNTTTVPTMVEIDVRLLDLPSWLAPSNLHITFREKHNEMIYERRKDLHFEREKCMVFNHAPKLRRDIAVI